VITYSFHTITITFIGFEYYRISITKKKGSEPEVSPKNSNIKQIDTGYFISINTKIALK